MKNKTAFTLLELSIVTIIIGLLIAGFLKSSSIIRSSKLATAKAITSKSPVPNISGLILWYETVSSNSFKASETKDGGTLTTWYDISPNAIAAKQNTLANGGGTTPIYKYNGINDLPSVQFSADAYMYKTTDERGLNRYSTSFAVFRPASVGASAQSLFDAGSTSGGRAIVFSTSGIGELKTDGSAVLSTATLTAGTNYIAAANHNSTSSQIFLNDPTTKIGNDLSMGTYNSTGMVVGAAFNYSLKYSGLISEIIIYNRILIDQERRDVMRYLAKKYNIIINP